MTSFVSIVEKLNLIAGTPFYRVLMASSYTLP